MRLIALVVVFAGIVAGSSRIEPGLPPPRPAEAASVPDPQTSGSQPLGELALEQTDTSGLETAPEQTDGVAVSLIRARSAHSAPADLGRTDRGLQAVAEPGVVERIVSADALAMLGVSAGLYCIGLVGLAIVERVLQREDLP